MCCRCWFWRNEDNLNTQLSLSESEVLLTQFHLWHLISWCRALFCALCFAELRMSRHAVMRTCFWNSSFRIEPWLDGDAWHCLDLWACATWLELLVIVHFGWCIRKWVLCYAASRALTGWKPSIIFRVWPMGWGLYKQLLDMMRCHVLHITPSSIRVLTCAAVVGSGEMRIT